MTDKSHFMKNSCFYGITLAIIFYSASVGLTGCCKDDWEPYISDVRVSSLYTHPETGKDVFSCHAALSNAYISERDASGVSCYFQFSEAEDFDVFLSYRAEVSKQTLAPFSSRFYLSAACSVYPADGFKEGKVYYLRVLVITKNGRTYLSKTYETLFERE